jgi:hypothetical protein
MRRGTPEKKYCQKFLSRRKMFDTLATKLSVFFWLNLIKAGGGGSEEVGRGVSKKT